MTVADDDITAAITGGIRPHRLDDNTFALLTPFTFHDGDGLPVILRRDAATWELTDAGGTAMHLSYDDVPYSTGNRNLLFEAIINAHGLTADDHVVSYRSSELPSPERVLDFVHALSQIADLDFLSRDTVASTFREDVRQFLSHHISAPVIFGWTHPDHDPNGTFPADLKADRQGDTPVLAFAVNSDTRAKDAALVLSAFERWREPVTSLVIFEDIESVGKKSLAQLTDVADKQFTSLAGNEERIIQHLGALGLAA